MILKLFSKRGFRVFGGLKKRLILMKNQDFGSNSGGEGDLDVKMGNFGVLGRISGGRGQGTGGGKN